MLDYINCNIQAHILYVINANNTIQYYTLYMILLVYTALHKAFVFFYEVFYHTSFLFVVYILFDDGILLVYHIAKYILFNYFRFRLPE